jgi:acyl-CoA reductase-like NAD-dependent aldehyde dehydrogenase
MTTPDTAGIAERVRGLFDPSPLKSFVGGHWIESSSGETLGVIDPGTGEKIVDAFAMNEVDVDSAMNAATDAYRTSGWATMSANERGVHLHRLADLIERDFDALADIEALDCGKLRANSPLDVQVFTRTIRYYADLAVHAQYSTPLPVADHEARIMRFPYGVCGFIVPWNFPFWLMGWGIAPALAAGNTVVIKPAEDTPLSTLYLCKLVAEAGIPAGVVNVVVGYGETAGAALAEHPGLKRMSFTGSPEVGKQVAEACARNLVPVKLELGGKGAAVVFDDVDIEDTAQKLCQAITFRTGQLCCDATRWIIHEKIYDDFLSSVTAKLEAVQVGHGFDSRSQMGPVINGKQRERILSYLEQGQAEGADRLLPGGPCSVSGCEGGFYVKPALLGGSLDNVAAREEVFGPVAYVTRFRDEAHGVELANATAYGLANSVWSADLDRCNRVAHAMVAGTSWINVHNTFPAGVPFGGVNLSGMGGGVNSVQTFYDYLRELAVARPYS